MCIEHWSYNGLGHDEAMKHGEAQSGCVLSEQDEKQHEISPGREANALIAVTIIVHRHDRMRLRSLVQGRHRYHEDRLYVQSKRMTRIR